MIFKVKYDNVSISGTIFMIQGHKGQNGNMTKHFMLVSIKGLSGMPMPPENNIRDDRDR